MTWGGIVFLSFPFLSSLSLLLSASHPLSPLSSPPPPPPNPQPLPPQAIFFVVYESLRRSLLPPPTTPTTTPATSPHVWADAAAAIACGAGAGAAMWGAVLPIDAVKTAIQAAPPGSRRAGLAETAGALMRAGGGGVRPLYAGLGPTLCRAAPANAAQWLAWELAVRGLGAGGE